MEYEGDVVTNCNRCARNGPQGNGKESGRLGIKRTSGDHTYYCIVKIGQNTEMSPGDLRRIAVIQTLVENHQLTLG